MYWNRRLGYMPSLGLYANMGARLFEKLFRTFGISFAAALLAFVSTSLATRGGGENCAQKNAFWPCRDGLVCQHREDVGDALLCKSGASRGKNCNTNRACEKGSYCKSQPLPPSLSIDFEMRTDPKNWKFEYSCFKAIGLGQGCTELIECGGTRQCDSKKGTCLSLLGQGQDCADTGECKDGLRCITSTKTCAKPLKLGEKCTRIFECSSDTACINGFCRDLPGEGEICSSEKIIIQLRSANPYLFTREATRVGLSSACSGNLECVAKQNSSSLTLSGTCQLRKDVEAINPKPLGGESSALSKNPESKPGDSQNGKNSEEEGGLGREEVIAIVSAVIGTLLAVPGAFFGYKKCCQKESEDESLGNGSQNSDD